MNAHEHTDPAGDGLTITHDDGKVWITCTTAHAEVTVGPLAPGILADHDMDGGVTAALIEKEAEPCPEDCDYRVAHGRLVKTYRDTLRRAEKAEQERDEMRDAWEGAIESVKEANALINSLRAAELRPLTAREQLDAAWELAHVPEDGTIPARTPFLFRTKHGTDRRVSMSLGAPEELPAKSVVGERRLLDPPTPARPEGAEDVQALIDKWADGWGCASDPSEDGNHGPLADFLASRGVRVEGSGR